MEEVTLTRSIAGGWRARRYTLTYRKLGSGGGRFTHLFDEVDSGLQVETEIDEFPLDALPLVLLLLKDEHLWREEIEMMMVRTRVRVVIQGELGRLIRGHKLRQ